MNKTAIKNFAVWARRKLISEITYKSGLIGISEKGILLPLSTSTDNIQFFDIGTAKPTEISNNEIKQRNALVNLIREKESTSDYKTAFGLVMEEVAYTWFNRLVAIRFMEVNDYLPSGIRVLSSEIDGKIEPDMVTTPFQIDMQFSPYETDRIMQLKDENKLDELFRMLFIKQCNKLNEILPELFEKTADYTELLLNISFTDSDGIVSHLVNDIEEEDFTEAVEIIGWMYQYYNEERKNEVINIYKGTVDKNDIPAATQLFTTDWVVRYMVDNSLGRYWIERNPQSLLQEKLQYFATPKDSKIQYVNEKIAPEEITFFDPCMGSGHILVYAFDILMEIYRECGYVDRDAVQSIVENNLFGLDIDNRAYQLAYFAIMMKARSYDRRFLTREIKPNVYPIYDYIEDTDLENEDLQYLANEFKVTKQYGSLINLKKDLDLKIIKNYVEAIQGQLILNTVNITQINKVICIAEILMNKYSVVCTNPPYLNKMNGELKNYINKHYKSYSGDLFSVFMYKNFDYCKPNGYSAFMTPFVWMFIKTYEQLREFIINNKSITTLIQMEYSAFEEATVPICSFVLKNGKESIQGLYFKLSEFKGGMEVQKQKVLEAIADKNCGYFYETSAESFSKIPGSPIAYWLSDKVLKVFNNKYLFDYARFNKGLDTGDNNRFLRLWYEINYLKFDIYKIKQPNLKWKPYNKGGAFRKWYGNNEYVINWYDNGAEVIAFKGSNIRNKDMYGNEGITWSSTSSGDFSCRYCFGNFLFDSKGCMAFAFTGREINYYLMGAMNTKCNNEFLKALTPTIDYNPGPVSRAPIVVDNKNTKVMTKLVSANIDLSKSDWDSFETSWDFTTHPLITYRSGAGYADVPMEKWKYKIADAYKSWESNAEARFNQLKANEEELNRIFIEIYGLQDELTPEVEDKDVTVRKADLLRDIKSFISYAIGCMFGRYSLDAIGLAYAGGEWDNSKYTTFVPDKDNCIPITDEEYLEDDIVGLFTAFVKKVYGADTLEENLDFIARVLDSKGNTSRDIIRNYFVKDFYKDHLKIYQKRPIYWLYDSGKQDGFKALVYMHRYKADTTGIVRVDYLHKMQRIYMSEIDRMQDMIENSNIAREISQAEKRKEKLVKQLKETKEYDEKIAHLALSRIDIDLDDGVKVNYEKVQTAKDGKRLEILGKI